jgi:hypothetical protein
VLSVLACKPPNLLNRHEQGYTPKVAVHKGEHAHETPLLLSVQALAAPQRVNRQRVRKLERKAAVSYRRQSAVWLRTSRFLRAFPKTSGGLLLAMLLGYYTNRQ